VRDLAWLVLRMVGFVAQRNKAVALVSSLDG